MRDAVKHLALEAKGFLLEQEGVCLYQLASECSQWGPCLEIGSYCGKSTLFLAEGCRVGGRHPLFALDHHRGSEEQQPGQPYFDPDLVDPGDQTVNTLAEFMRNLRQAGLTDWVIPLVGDSRRVSQYWRNSELSLLFIDAGHSEEDAFGDFHAWAGRVVPGGYLCIHDVFPNPADGGQAPLQVFEHAQSTGDWEFVQQVASLGVLRKRTAQRASYVTAGAPRRQPLVETTRFLGAAPTPRGPNWIILGQDGGQSIPLGDQTLFVFSDTLLATPSKPEASSHITTPVQRALNQRGSVIANSAGLSNQATLTRALGDIRYFTDTAGFPREILVPTPEEQARGLRFWPEHGVCLDHTVYLFYLGIETVDTSAWGFRNLGVGLARLDPATGVCERLEHHGDWCFWPTVADDLHIGVQVLRVEDDLYVFASRRTGVTSDALVARVKASRITDPTAYEFVSSALPEWSADPEQAASLGPCSPEYSVSYNAYLRQYLMVYVDGYDKNLVVRTAERPVGPYSQPQKVARVPHSPTSELVYLGFEHPTFSERDGQIISVSYCQPRFTPMSLVRLRLR